MANARNQEPMVPVSYVFLPLEGTEVILLCISPQTDYVPVTTEELRRLEEMGGHRLLLVNGQGETWEETPASVRAAWVSGRQNGAS